MVKKFFFIVACFLLVACSDNTIITIPDNVLSEEKMAGVLTDMQLMEASMNITGVDPKNVSIDIARTNLALNIDVLKKHNITKKQFDDSFSFYIYNPTLLSEVYQLVLNDLSRMQAEVQKKK